MPEIYQGRSISPGIGEGEALVTTQPLSFFGGVDPDSGTVTEKGHELFRVKVSGKVLILPHLKGSTASTWVFRRLSEKGTAPSAIIARKADIILIAGAILGNIPTVDNLDRDPTVEIRNGQRVRVNGDNGTVEVVSE
jgi:predicted aconitase with swiveling domain